MGKAYSMIVSLFRTEASMSAAVEFTHVNHTTEALHGLAAKSNNGPQVRRRLALALSSFRPWRSQMV